nr:hypothetical protein [Marinifilum flexuosum]
MPAAKIRRKEERRKEKRKKGERKKGKKEKGKKEKGKKEKGKKEKGERRKEERRKEKGESGREKGERNYLLNLFLVLECIVPSIFINSIDSFSRLFQTSFLLEIANINLIQ